MDDVRIVAAQQNLIQGILQVSIRHETEGVRDRSAGRTWSSVPPRFLAGENGHHVVIGIEERK